MTKTLIGPGKIKGLRPDTVSAEIWNFHHITGSGHVRLEYLEFQLDDTNRRVGLRDIRNLVRRNCERNPTYSRWSDSNKEYSGVWQMGACQAG
jgi:hypothetical protein